MQPSGFDSIKRFTPSPSHGLTNMQVAQRLGRGLSNAAVHLPTKTIPRIIQDNTLTLFNIINLILAIAVFFTGSYKNMLFMGVVISNLIIGTVQEIRAKMVVDNLSFISCTKVKVIRQGQELPINIDQIVLDDIILLESGNQVPTDCIICEGECDVNESLLTGESDSLTKNPGDSLLSGSFLVSGRCKAKADKVGKDNYISTISQSAKYVKKVNSQIMNTFNKIILIVSVIIIPVGGLSFWRQLYSCDGGVSQAVLNTVGALTGMIPEGLILLTSTVLAVGVIRLAKQKVLVQEIHCIETLARTDVLCLDKTGTITEGTMEVAKIVPCSHVTSGQMSEALGILCANLNDQNPTFLAIKKKYSQEQAKSADKIVPFSSKRKWSGVHVPGFGCAVLGAAEFILPKSELSKIQMQANKYSKEHRVLLLAQSSCSFNEFDLPANMNILGFVLIKDKIRSEAAKTLEYFAQQGVELKIISGDSPVTVMNIAKAVGLKSADKYIDMSQIDSEQDLKQAAEDYTVFGRTSPLQKQQLICALKQNGHTVAMTGDGINDVLALKEADCSIAVASGSEAARNVSQLVLLNSSFDTLPRVVAEGRRCINNIERSSSLFLVKTIYSVMLAIIFIFMRHRSYPFVPIQMTPINALTIGIPSFILAMEPNHDRVKGNFFLNILGKAAPGALTIVITVFLIHIAAIFFNIPSKELSVLSIFCTAFTGFSVLYEICKPFTTIRKFLLGASITAFAGTVIFVGSRFELPLFSSYTFIIGAILGLLASVYILRANSKVFDYIFRVC